MTRNPDKYHLACASGEVITVTAADNASGASAAYDTKWNGAVILPAIPIRVAPGSTVLSVSIGYPNDAGGSSVVTLSSTTGERETYRFQQTHNHQDGCVIELTA